MADISTIFKNFQGNWAIDIVKHSPDGKIISSGQGTAIFEPFNSSDTELFFHEKGLADYSPEQNAKEDQKINFSRSYLYKLNGDMIEVYQASIQNEQKHIGVHYQNYQLNDIGNELQAIKPHECPSIHSNRIDYYNGFYALADKNKFTLITKISNTKDKDGIIKIEFIRL